MAAQIRRLAIRSDEVVRRDVDVEREVHPAAARRQRPVERLGLAPGPRKAVEHGAAAGVGGRETLEEDVDDGVVGHELAAAHVPVGGTAERRARGDRGAEQVAGRQHRHAEAPGQDRRLRPLPGARCAEKDHTVIVNPVAPQMASPAEGAAEDGSERTSRCVSARPEAATHGWAARCGAVVAGTVI